MAKREKFSNVGFSTLNGAINSSVTSLVVTSAATFPTDGNFRIRIDTEILLVTAVSGTTFTVVRGVESTTAASHSSGTAITHVLTAASLLRFAFDNYPLFGATEVPIQNSITDTSDNILDSGDFTWVNQGTATATDLSNGNISLVKSAADGFNCLVRTAPATPYTVTASFTPMCHGDGDNWAGMVLRESGTGKLLVHYTRGSDDVGAAGVDQVGVSYWTDHDTFSSAPVLVKYHTVARLGHWQRITDNGTNIILQNSVDGINWQTQGTLGRTAFAAGGFNQVGIAVGRAAPGSKLTSLVLTHWSGA